MYKELYERERTDKKDKLASFEKHQQYADKYEQFTMKNELDRAKISVLENP
jgi:hypothetical protein